MRNLHNIRQQLFKLTRSYSNAADVCPLGQRSKLAGDGRENLVKSCDPETLKGYEPKHTRIFSTVRPRAYGPLLVYIQLNLPAVARRH